MRCDIHENHHSGCQEARNAAYRGHLDQSIGKKQWKTLRSRYDIISKKQMSSSASRLADACSKKLQCVFFRNEKLEVLFRIRASRSQGACVRLIIDNALGASPLSGSLLKDACVAESSNIVAHPIIVEYLTEVLDAAIT